MAKAKSFSEDEEKTTTDDEQWSEEASTTVEQGEAERLRSLIGDPPRRTGMGTGGNALDEPTVDDQRANPAIVMAPVMREAPAVARLIVTQGSDSGQELAIYAGKAYTIGRGLDNDFVLTDISVSRKHFDLRNDDGAWVIVDRGSGNGTVVNGNLEDNPFMLANGDLIEIGNTVFRFEHANGVARANNQFSVDDDDDAMSTIAGRKSPAEAATPIEAPLPDLVRREPNRPKTLPPPTPLRPPPVTSAPTFLPPAVASVPLSSPVAPTLIAASNPPAQMPHRQLEPFMPRPAAIAGPLPGMLPTTIPGQGPPMAPLPLVAGYPQVSEIPPHSVHAQMLRIAANASRHDPSTAHVAPTPFIPVMPPSQVRFANAQSLSRRTKVVLGASGAALLAIVVSVAVLKSGSATSAPARIQSAEASPPTASGSAATVVTPAPSPAPTRPAVPPAPTPPAPTAVTPPPPPTVTPPPPTALSAKAQPQDTRTDKAQARNATPVAQMPVSPTAKNIKPETSKLEASVSRPEAKSDRHVKRSSSSDSSSANGSSPSVNASANNTPPKRVATVDVSDVRRQADAAYRAKHFSEAQSLLTAAARNASDEDAQQLRHRADLVASFGRYYSAGTAPAASPVEQFEKLRQAENYDSSLGNVFNGDIDNRLQAVSSKAAVQYMGKGQYDKALTAVEKAESLGTNNDNIKAVRATLNSKASDLYTDAKAEADSNPSDAKDKLHKMLNMIDAKSTFYARGKQLLTKLGN